MNARASASPSAKRSSSAMAAESGASRRKIGAAPSISQLRMLVQPTAHRESWHLEETRPAHDIGQFIQRHILPTR